MYKKRAMTSVKASEVKLAGHKNEVDFAELVGGSRVPGTGKADCIWNDQKYSIKKVCKRIQFALYKQTSTYWNTTSASLACLQCLGALPDTYEKYQESKHESKLKLAEAMKHLKEVLEDKSNLRDLLDLFIRNGEIHGIVMEDTCEYKIYDAKEVIDLLTDNLVVENSKAIKAHDYANQKVILKNIHNVIELEIRNSSAGHYREFLCVCNRDKLMKMLLKLVPIVVRKL